jgi:hypothetical protein
MSGIPRRPAKEESVFPVNDILVVTIGAGIDGDTAN